jgi:hypothetical protein
MIAVRERVAHDRIGKASGVPRARQLKKGGSPACDFVNRLCHQIPPSPASSKYTGQIMIGVSIDERQLFR